MASSALHTPSSEVSAEQEKGYTSVAWNDVQGRNSKTEANLDLDREGEEHGYVLDASDLRHSLHLPDGAPIKTASDGHTVLIPQPSDDPQDPLNWPLRKKNLIMLVVSLVSCTADFGSAIGAVTLLPQAQYV